MAPRCALPFPALAPRHDRWNRTARFQKEFPGVALQLQELSTSDQIPALQARQIHYGFVHSSALPAGISSRVLMREPFLLCLPAHHPRAGSRSAKLSEFRNEPFVLFSRAFSPSYYDQVVARCLAAGFHPHIQHQVRHWLTVLACVARGMGITLAPRALAKADFPGVSFVRIEASPVESVVYGAWLSDDDNVILPAWHRIVEEEVTA